MVGYSWDDLAGLSLARQFPQAPSEVAAMIDRIGPVQSQTARSPFLALAARFPGTTRDAITAAYDSGAIVRGSTVRGTVHTATPSQYVVLGAATRVGQRTLWQRLLRLERSSLEDLWADTEAFAAGWRSTHDLQVHLHDWLMSHEGRDEITHQQVGRHLAFGHGGLVRRPVNGDWAGQGAAEYATLPAVVDASISDALELHVRRHGPSSRHDLAWWSGLGLRVVDAHLDRLPLVGVVGPDGRTYLDLPGPAPARSVEGVRLLPEFDALMCGYEPAGRERFADPAHLARLWNGANGLVLPPLMVDGRLTGFWRATGTAKRRPLDVVWFARTRRPRAAELEAPVAALETALGISITGVSITRESV